MGIDINWITGLTFRFPANRLILTAWNMYHLVSWPVSKIALYSMHRIRFDAMLCYEEALSFVNTNLNN